MRFHSDRIALAMAATAVMMSGHGAGAQTAPDTENGRYTLSPVTDGFLRLNTRNGEVSICTNKNGWTCRLVPDERTALDSEIGRLQSDNKQLRDQLARRDLGKDSGKTETPVAKGDTDKSAQAAPDKNLDLQLPPEHEKLLALIDRIWDRMIDMAVRLQKRLSEKI